MPDWPHSPTHRLNAVGAYMVTASTYQKQPLFHGHDRLGFLCETLLGLAVHYEWKLEAWAVFPNHYHFVAGSPEKSATLRRFIGHLHTLTAKKINEKDDAAGRKVWFQYWESRITFQRSYLARLNYVHANAVKHGLAQMPEEYPWCSAGWFRRKAEKPFYETVMRMRSNGINITDDFVVSKTDIESSEPTAR